MEAQKVTLNTAVLDFIKCSILRKNTPYTGPSDVECTAASVRQLLERAFGDQVNFRLIYNHFHDVIHGMIRDDHAKRMQDYRNAGWFKRFFIPKEDQPNWDISRLLNTVYNMYDHCLPSNDNVTVALINDMYAIGEQKYLDRWKRTTGMSSWIVAACLPNQFYSVIEDKCYCTVRCRYELWMVNTFYLFGAVAVHYANNQRADHESAMLRHKRRPYIFGRRLVRENKPKY